MFKERYNDIYRFMERIYNNLKNIGYKHMAVNHSKIFKYSVTGVHTNAIEGTWNGLKQSIISRNMNKKDIALNLKEYQWRKKIENMIYG